MRSIVRSWTDVIETMLTKQWAKKLAVSIIIVGAFLAVCTGITLGIILIYRPQNSSSLIALTVTSGSCAVLFGVIGNFFRIRNLPSCQSVNAEQEREHPRSKMR
jgi:hypothetical protein